MSLNDQMQSAKAYIKAKDYDSARRILKTVDHPTAKDWLAKIDKLSPPNPPPSPLAKLGITIAQLALAVVVATLAMMLLDASGWWEFNLGRDYDARQQAETIMLILWVVIAIAVWGAAVYYTRQWQQGHD